MAKRFIDTSTYNKAFRKLAPSLKLSWFYLWTNCDASGVWEIDEDLFEFENGFEFDLDEIGRAFSGKIEIYEGKILLVDFIIVNNTKLKDNYNPHKPVFRAIEKNNLKLNSSLNQASFKLVGVGEGKEEDKDKGGVGEKEEKLLAPKKIADEFNRLCPSLPKVEKMTDSRKSHIRARQGEHGDKIVLRVFEKAEASSFLKGGSEKGWKANFDWVMNPNNFLKILEGNYDNSENNGKEKHKQSYSKSAKRETKPLDYSERF